MFKNRPPQQTSSTAPRVAPNRTRSLVAVFALATTLISVPALADAPYLRAAKPITDDQGRVQVIVDFTETARQTYPQSLVATVGAAAQRHRSQTLNLVADFEKKYQFARTGMTS